MEHGKAGLDEIPRELLRENQGMTGITNIPTSRLRV